MKENKLMLTIKNVGIVLVFAFILLNNKAFDQNYFFSTEEEGIYKIENPFGEENTGFVVVQSDRLRYKPFYDAEKDSFYVYGEAFSTYQISSDSLLSDFEFKFNIPNEKVITKRNDYFSDVYRSKNNWFHKIIEPLREYEERIFVGHNRSHNQIDLKIVIYNFFSRNVNFDLIVNDSIYNIAISPKTEKPLLFKTILVNGFINLKILSSKKRIGIVCYKYSIVDRDFGYNLSFSKYKFSRSQIFDPLYVASMDSAILSRYSDEYLLLTVCKDGSFSKLEFSDTMTSFTNLFLSKTIAIRKAELNLVKNLNEYKYDTASYIVLYDVRFKEYINDIENLLKQTLQNCNVISIDVQLVYNKYSYSHKSSGAIKKFLQEKKPKYVLLIGDASNKKGDPNNIIPTFNIKAIGQNTIISSDYPYVYDMDIAEPNIALGRIPVTSAAELKIVIDKLLKFLSNKDKKTNLVFDELPNTVNPFKGKIETVYEVVRQRNSIVEALSEKQMISSINMNKPHILLHKGHGSKSSWNRVGKVDADDFRNIEKGNLFIVFDLSCHTGFFDHYKQESLSEKLLEQDKSGAVSIISASSYTNIKYYDFMMKEFLEHRGEPIGEILNKTKVKLFTERKLGINEMFSYNLLGIPSLK